MESSTKLANAIALIGILVMTNILVYAFATGNLTEEGIKLFSMGKKA